MYLCICVGCGGEHVSAVVLRVQKRALGPLEPKLQACMSRLLWVLESELRSSGKIANTLSSPEEFLQNSQYYNV